jgi:hypothetical protein
MSDKRDSDGRFAPGNRFWEARSSHGRNPLFTDPDALWAACCEYFDWNDSNPLYEDNLVTFQGHATHEPLARMRAMTIGGLCMFLDVDETTWRGWRADRADLIPIISRAESVIYRQKFEGASASMLNPNIIARDLGLADRKELSNPDGTLAPVVVEFITPQVADARED